MLLHKQVQMWENILSEVDGLPVSYKKTSRSWSQYLCSQIDSWLNQWTTQLTRAIFSASIVASSEKTAVQPYSRTVCVATAYARCSQHAAPCSDICDQFKQTWSVSLMSPMRRWIVKYHHWDEQHFMKLIFEIDRSYSLIVHRGTARMLSLSHQISRLDLKSLK